MASKITALPLKRIVSNVEVERKFNPGLNFVSLLSGYSWTKQQAQSHEISNHKLGGALSVLSKPGQLIRDTYYDTEDSHLSNLGFWVRQRCVHANLLPLHYSPGVKVADGRGEAGWNAKLRVGGHFTNSQFVEFDGKKDVSREVLRISEARTRLEDLQVVADLQTRRSVWEVVQLLDGTSPSAEMTIVVDVVTEAEASEGPGTDKASFNHTVGEVELFQPVITEGEDNVEHEAHRKEIAMRRMAELETFMLAHADLFSTRPTPIGKLTAYYRWKTAASQPSGERLSSSHMV